jgi:glucosamine--fructose-6-phosphate aminotransferase (isomerizing)
VVNVPESSIARESDLALPIHAGAEIGVASTKAFTCQLVVLSPAGAEGRADRGRMARQLADRLSQLRAVPGMMNQALDRAAEIAAVARELAEARDVLFLGRGRCIRWRWKAR